MKTLTKNNLDTMAKILPELDELEQRGIVGGTGSCSEVTGCTTMAPTGYTWEQMESMVDDGTWTGGMVDGYGYFGGVVVVTGSFVVATGSFWSTVADALWEMIPDAVSVNVSFDLTFLGGGGYNAGFALPLKGEDAGKIYSYDTYEFTMGAHGEVSVNAGFSYFSGKDEDFDFDKVFAGKGGGVEADYLGGIALGISERDKNGNFLITLQVGGGASIGAAVNVGSTNVREIGK